MATRFWVGGTGPWDGTTTTHWAATSGGAGGQTVPTAADSVTFDGNSGVGTATIQTATALCASLDCTNYTGTLAGAVAMQNSGSLTWGTGMTRTYSGAITFKATSGGQTITSNGKNFGGNLIFDGVGGAWTLQDDWTQPAANFVQLTNGSLTTGAHTFTWGALRATTATRGRWTSRTRRST
jgi:hypothetical protein